ncbi:MAG TPA: glycosyltransferase family 4 protein [Candidatus Limnocylindria bacterium]|nr:glycosyltransferase family 4 protein [Candidatus Limnocylindria bacterium]
MKIGFVLDDSLDKTDGVQQYVITIGQWLRSHGHDVHYLVGHTERTDLPDVHSLSRNVQVHFNQNRMSTPLPISAKKIRRLLAAEQFDVLHVQMPYSPFMAAKVIKNAPPGTAIVGTFHILPFSRIEAAATRVLAVALRRSRKKFDMVVSVSEPAARFARKRFKVKGGVVPNAVPVAHFQAGKKLRKYNDGKLNIVYLGRLVERKGCMHLLEAIEHLHQKHMLHTVRVIVGGKGPLLPKLEKYVQDHRLGKHVQFIGFVPEEDKPDLLASADIAVMPSLGGESFGIVLVEAMAAGAGVVVAGSNKGYRAVMGTHKDQVVDPTDTQAFAKMLKHFLFNANARKRAKKWQQTHAMEYDVQAVGRQLLGIYTEAVRKKAESGR